MGLEDKLSDISYAIDRKKEDARYAATKAIFRLQRAWETPRTKRGIIAGAATAVTALVAGGALAFPSSQHGEDERPTSASTTEATEWTTPETPKPVPIGECYTGDSGQPRSHEELMCKERVTGNLAVVVVPGFDDKPGMYLRNPQVVGKFAEYTTRMLNEISGGAIQLKPVVTYPDEATTKAIVSEVKNTNEGYVTGTKYIDTDDEAAQIGDAVKKVNPGLTEHTQTIIVSDAKASMLEGGRAFIDDEGTISELYLGETAILHGQGDTPEVTAGNFAAHEVGHNMGLGHEYEVNGSSQFENTIKDPLKPIPLSLLQNAVVDTSSSGNIMSYAITPLIPGNGATPDMLTNCVQKDYLTRDSQHPNTLHHLQDGEHITLPLNKGATVPLGTSIQLADRYFDDISFEPDRDGKSALVVLSSNPDDLVETARFKVSLSTHPRIIELPTGTVALSSKGQGKGINVAFTKLS